MAAKPESVAALIAQLRSEGEQVPRAAITELCRVGAPAVPDLRQELTQGKDVRGRRWAAVALGELGDEGAVPLLRRVLDEKPMSLRLHAMEALARLQGVSCAALLRKLSTRDESGGVRLRALEALIGVGGPQLRPCLRQCLEDDKWYVRQRAAQVLGILRDQRARQALTRLATEDPHRSVLRAASAAIAAIEQLDAVGRES